MKVTPIMFGATMVRALDDGTKTQTRRVVGLDGINDSRVDSSQPVPVGDHWQSVIDDLPYNFSCPYGTPGDLLWVREAWRPESESDTGAVGIRYQCDAHYEDCDRRLMEYFDGTDRWRPPSHLPRWASRLTLRITDVRVQRLQSISDIGVMGEGCALQAWPWVLDRPRSAGFAMLWDSINGKRGYGWKTNPWVWALTFTVIRANVDEVTQ